MSANSEYKSCLALEQAVEEENKERLNRIRRERFMAKRAHEADIKRGRLQFAGLLAGASLLVAGIYAGVAAYSLNFPSTGDSTVNTVPPTHLMTFDGHREGVSAQVNWELAKAAGNITYKKQLIVVANLDLLKKDPHAGMEQRGEIRDEIGAYLQSDGTFTPNAIRIATKATPAQVEAGAILIGEHITRVADAKATPPVAAVPGSSEKEVLSHNTSLSREFIESVRGGKVTMDGAKLIQRLNSLATEGKINAAEVNDIKSQWNIVTASKKEIELGTVFSAANRATTDELLSFVQRTKSILATSRDEKVVDNTMKRILN